MVGDYIEMRKKKVTVTNMILACFVFAVILPAAVMLLWTVTERWAWPDLFPQVFSMRAFEGILKKRGTLTAIFLSSIMISSAVAVLSAAIGTLTARALVLYEFRGKGLLHFLTVLPFMVPATVFAMGIQVTFIKMGLNNTVMGVAVSHLICSLPYAVRLMTDGTAAVGDRLEEQARVLGASAVQAFVRVTLPILAPMLLSAFCMSYIVSFSQYFLTLLIGGGQVKTFTVVMVPYLKSGERNIACAYSVIFLGITLAVFGIFEKIADRWSRNLDTEFYA